MSIIHLELVECDSGCVKALQDDEALFDDDEALLDEVLLPPKF